MRHEEHERRGHVLDRRVYWQPFEQEVPPTMLDSVEGLLFKQELFALLGLDIIVLKRQRCDHQDAALS